VYPTDSNDALSRWNCFCARLFFFLTSLRVCLAFSSLPDTSPRFIYPFFSWRASAPVIRFNGSTSLLETSLLGISLQSHFLRFVPPVKSRGLGRREPARTLLERLLILSTSVFAWTIFPPQLPWNVGHCPPSDYYLHSTPLQALPASLIAHGRGWPPVLLFVAGFLPRLGSNIPSFLLISPLLL